MRSLGVQDQIDDELMWALERAKLDARIASLPLFLVVRQARWSTPPMAPFGYRPVPMIT
jgi:hypothetical protein